MCCNSEQPGDNHSEKEHRGGRCQCPGMTMDRFMQPCLLLLLQRHPAHGYELIQSLSDSGLMKSDPDPGSVYRHLRRLEEDGFVSSEWQTGGSGPAKRLYRLTPEGKEVLAAWVQTITNNKMRMERFLSYYQRQTKSEL